ncbi:hypothetical protein V8F20_006031 [Naviculisporaceae sp. PSN 640]
MTPSRVTSLGWALVSLSITATIPGTVAQGLGPNARAIKDTYDYVIVGGGTSGLTVGDRLSEDGKYSVLAIEYGYIEPDGLRLGQNTYNITSAPASGLHNKTFSVDVGCIVGGSSAVNGRNFQRGTRDDYDIWSELGGSGENGAWSWKGILKYFRKAVQLVPPNPDIPQDFNLTVDYKYWGTDNGNRSIFAMYGNTIPPNAYPLYQGTKALPGINVPTDGGSGELGLLYMMQATDPRTGQRSYARSAHWDDLNRPNYDLLVGTRVNKIMFEGKSNTAVGVQITPRGSRGPSTIIKAKREVILAAGTIHTPQILQLSGIGPAKLLKQAGIKVVEDLPGVGANFQDHTYVDSVSFKWGTPPPVPASLVAATPASNGISRTYLGLSVPLSVVAPSNFTNLANSLLSQNPASVFPKDTHPSILKGYKKQQSLLAKSILSSSNGALSYLRISLTPLFVAPTDDPNVSPLQVSYLPINIHPFSRGTVLIDAEKTKQAGSIAAASEIEPVVDYRALSNPLDIDLIILQVRYLREMFLSKEGPFGQYNATEITPGAEIQSDEELEAWIRQKLVPSVYHPVGTCAKMKRELGGVVDEELKVYGTKGLRIVDASMFPIVVGATTSMSVYAVAEKAADLIKADQ